jgi:hypothetical protein
MMTDFDVQRPTLNLQPSAKHGESAPAQVNHDRSVGVILSIKNKIGRSHA